MECLYTKYNRHRLPQFQIETSILQVGDRRVVVKRALTSEAGSHIRSMARAYSLIARNLVGDRARLPGGFHEDQDSVRFDYVDGASLDRLLFEAFLDRNADRFLSVIDDYTDLLRNAFKTVPKPEITEQLKQVFGLSSVEALDGQGPCFALSLVDPVFENILVHDGRYYLIDNEWVFDGCLPVSFALFRSLFYFYRVKCVDFGIESLVPFDAVLGRYGLNPQIVKRYREMDDRFQAYVFGSERCYGYKLRYAKQIYSVPLLEKTIEHQRGIVREMHDQITHLKDLVQSKQELILDKDRLIGEMNQLILDKDQVIADVMNSRGWQFVQKATRIFDRICPPGTRRRRIAARLMKLSESGDTNATNAGRARNPN